MTDEELVQKSLENPDNYEAIILAYERPIQSFIRRLSQMENEDVEDLTQQVFIKAYYHLNDFDTDLKLSTWLFRIARNEVIDFWRRQKSRPQTTEWDPILEETMGAEADFVDVLDKKIQSEWVEKILQNLNPKYREVLYLYFFLEKSYEEISDIVRKPPGTVAALISRGKNAFADSAKRHKIREK